MSLASSQRPTAPFEPLHPSLPAPEQLQAPANGSRAANAPFSPNPGAAVPGICPCHRHRDPERRLIPFARPSLTTQGLPSPAKPRQAESGRTKPGLAYRRGSPDKPHHPLHPPCPRRSLGERGDSRPPARTLTGESPRTRQRIHIPATFKTTPPRRSPESKKINSKGPKGEDWRRRWKSRPSRQQHRRQTTPRLRAQSEVKT